MRQYRLLSLPLAIVAFERLPQVDGFNAIDIIASNDAEAPGVEEWDDLGMPRWYGDGADGYLAVFVGHPIVWYWQVQEEPAAPVETAPPAAGD